MACYFFDKVQRGRFAVACLLFDEVRFILPLDISPYHFICLLKRVVTNGSSGAINGRFPRFHNGGETLLSFVLVSLGCF
jgi:hypothetical protein